MQLLSKLVTRLSSDMVKSPEHGAINRGCPLSRTTDVLDAIMDRSIVLGYSRLGYAVRQSWWKPDDPRPEHWPIASW